MFTTTPSTQYWTFSKLANEARQSGDIYRFEDIADEAADSDLYGLYYGEADPAEWL